MTDTLFDHALAHVLAMEGGYAEDPHDPGGPTNFGITLATYARDKDVALTPGSFDRLKAELKAIPRAIVRRIYRTRYWQPARCPDLPPALALFHFDCAVNQGVGGAARMLQEAVGAPVDGAIGPDTLARVAARPVPSTLARYAAVRRRHYRSLATFWRFGRGWLARVDHALAAARALPPARSSLRQSQPEEPQAMTGQNPSTAAPPASTKWWGASRTIWGAIVTALATVLPVVAPLLGLDLTADLVRQLGEQVVLVVQAVGGLAGTILTIYGRMHATTTLARQQLTLSL